MRQGQCSTSGRGAPSATLSSPHRRLGQRAFTSAQTGWRCAPACASSGAGSFLRGHAGSSSLGRQAEERRRRQDWHYAQQVQCAAQDTVSPQAWRQNWRFHRFQAAQQKQQLPEVDWGRYHLQVLFVDHSDTVRARVATGLFELVAEWNGFGRALYASACGVAAAEGPDPATTVALMAQASRLGIRPKLFAQQPEQFVYEDFDRSDIIVAVDDEVLKEVLAVAGGPSDQAWYAPRCTTITAFQRYCGGRILQRGGAGVLQPEMRAIVAPVLARAMQTRTIPRPDLHKGPAEWNPMVENMLVGLAGLVQYFIDAYPPSLREYDPV